MQHPRPSHEDDHRPTAAAPVSADAAAAIDAITDALRDVGRALIALAASARSTAGLPRIRRRPSRERINLEALDADGVDTDRYRQTALPGIGGGAIVAGTRMPSGRRRRISMPPTRRAVIIEAIHDALAELIVRDVVVDMPVPELRELICTTAVEIESWQPMLGRMDDHPPAFGRYMNEALAMLEAEGAAVVVTRTSKDGRRHVTARVPGSNPVLPPDRTPQEIRDLVVDGPVVEVEFVDCPPITAPADFAPTGIDRASVITPPRGDWLAINGIVDEPRPTAPQPTARPAITIPPPFPDAADDAKIGS